MSQQIFLPGGLESSDQFDLSEAAIVVGAGADFLLATPRSYFCSLCAINCYYWLFCRHSLTGNSSCSSTIGSSIKKCVIGSASSTYSAATVSVTLIWLRNSSLNLYSLHVILFLTSIFNLLRYSSIPPMNSLMSNNFTALSYSSWQFFMLSLWPILGPAGRVWVCSVQILSTRIPWSMILC